MGYSGPNFRQGGEDSLDYILELIVSLEDKNINPNFLTISKDFLGIL